MASRDDRRRTNERSVDNGERVGWNLAAYSRRSSKVRRCQCPRDRKAHNSRYSRDSSGRRALRRDRRDESGRSSRGGNNGLSKVSKNQRLYRNHSNSSNRVSFKQSSQSRVSSSRSGSRRSSRASSSKRLYRRRTTAAARRLEAALKKKAAENQSRRNRRARRVSYAAATSNENVSGNENPNNAAIAPTAVAPPVRSDGLPPRPPRDAAPVQRSERKVNNSAPPPPGFANREAPLGPVIRGFQSAARHPRGKFYGNTPQPDSDDETEEERIRRLSKAYQALRQQGYLQKCLGQPVQINFGETDAEIPDITTDGQEQDDKKYSDTPDWGPIPPVRTDFSHLVTAGPYKKSAASSKNNEYPSKGISAHWQEQHPKWKDSRYHIDKPYPCTCELCQSPPKKFPSQLPPYRPSAQYTYDRYVYPLSRDSYYFDSLPAPRTLPRSNRSTSRRQEPAVPSFQAYGRPATSGISNPLRYRY